MDTRLLINNISYIDFILGGHVCCHRKIAHIDSNNQDAALVEITETESEYVISYWDGYSLSEIEECNDVTKAQRIFKRFAKKMAKNLKRFSST